MDRRTFVYNAALGTLHVGLGGNVLRTQQPSALDSLKIALHAPDFTPSKLAMPGLFPGRVVEVFHPGAIVAGHRAGGADDAHRRYCVADR